jgi:hypothetical protein
MGICCFRKWVYVDVAIATAVAMATLMFQVGGYFGFKVIDLVHNDVTRLDAREACWC